MKNQSIVDPSGAFAPKEILCPVDFGELSGLALKYAAVGAREFGAGLTLLHAATFDVPRYFSRSESDRLIQEYKKARQAVRNQLDDYARKTLGAAFDSLPVTVDVAERQPAEAISDAMEHKPFDLVIMGTEGLGGLKRFLLGSVTESVVRTSRVPVFTIRQMEHNFIDVDQVDAVPRIKSILCPCNGPETAVPSLRIAVSMAERFQARLKVMYVVEKDQKSGQETVDMKSLCSWLSGTVAPQCSLEPVIREGNAAEQIIALAREEKDDIIILGANHKPFLESTFLGRTTELVLRHAPVPVLAVPRFPES